MDDLFLYGENGKEIPLPTCWAVCDRCHGEGKHSNPAIDGNGITASEMDEMCYHDEDFAENYFGGLYDVTCHQCDGKRVMKVVNLGAMSEEDIAEYQSEQEQRRIDELESYYERRAGA